ncbi:NAD(P)H-hydrate dehydratase [Nioella aestuarii]|uniref:NAD(P)H-hydrate dehydratase n=1 Tax=Nioella aestuarii TaxID=1662864 RepID=UPI003D7FC334
MTELLTAAQMRMIETAAMESGTVSGQHLMERAGQGVVTAIMDQWPELRAGSLRALVLCGPGNNGGDGFVIARLLHDAGWQVSLYLYGEQDRLPPDAALNCARWQALGAVLPWDEEAIVSATADLTIDAVFGAGLTRLVPQEVVSPMVIGRSKRGRACRNVAVDSPTGLCMDSGRLLVEDHAGVPNADLTVTFHRARLGHYLADGPQACGRIALVDIGLEPRRADAPGALAPPGGGLGPLATLVDAPGALDKRAGAHKYEHGHALVLSGPMGRSGAARLAARGALRIGAGLVTVAAPGSAMMECACQLTAIMLRKCDGAQGLAEMLADERLNALCLGPGLGVGQGTCDMVAMALAARRGTVLDADALTSFTDAPGLLFAQLHDRCVLTPHRGEFARLFPDLAAKLAAPCTRGPAYSKLDATREAAVRAGCAVLFKGPDTVIAAPDGQACIHSAAYDRAAPWLSTAGSGDVLAGVITGLLARHVPPKPAAEAAAWFHTEAARSFGAGLVAEDLAEQMPSVLQLLSDQA